jgi:hypothetical protein
MIYTIYMNAGIENVMNKKYISDCKNYIIRVKSFTISRKFINTDCYYLGYSSINGRYEYKKINSLRRMVFPVFPFKDKYFIFISKNIKIGLLDEYEITDDEFNNYINNTFDNPISNDYDSDLDAVVME